MATVYYKADGNKVYYTNEAKEGYVTTKPSISGKEVVVELYNNTFILPQDSTSLFMGCSNTSFDNSGLWDTSGVRIMKQAFYGCSRLTSLYTSNWDTHTVTDFSYMFANCSSLVYLDVMNFSMRAASMLDYMFYNCSSITSLNLSSWATEINTVSDMWCTFANCSSLLEIFFPNPGTIEYGTFNPKFHQTFYGCSNLKKVDMRFITHNSLVSGFDETFKGCTNLQEVNLGFLGDLSDKRDLDFSSTFENCSKLRKIDLSGVEKLSSLYRAFANCTSLEEVDFTGLKSFRNGANVDEAFTGCGYLENIYVKSPSDWKEMGCDDGDRMFYNCKKLPNFTSSKIDSTRAHDHELGYFKGKWIPDVITPYMKKTDDEWLEGTMYIKTNSGWKAAEVYK